MPYILSSDTLRCDTMLLRQWSDDPRFDYESSLQGSGSTLMDELRWWLSHKLDEWFRWTVTEEQVNWIFIGVGVLLLLVVLYVIYRKNPQLFGRVGKNARTSSDTLGDEDTIYGVDFRKEIDKALQAANYYQAVRYRYLFTLKEMNDMHLIGWQPYKTPTEYVYELADASRRDTFRRLTNNFMRVRYGNFQATRQLYDDMKEQANELLERREEK